ncbi:hypothetical protein CRG98_006413 [Punica granatum]|uniref:Uncharacterized protein n=1 Tax=Punica granatum TaxID=22663 RepID=A0A2I0KXL5_PUNGR|nr:hypothetical protein CRG98_006413 [Punica granatum]
MVELHRQIEGLQQCLKRYEARAANNDEEYDNPFYRDRVSDSSDDSSMHQVNQWNQDQDFGIKVEVPTFEGRPQSDEFTSWLYTLEQIFDNKNLPEECKVKLLSNLSVMLLYGGRLLRNKCFNDVKKLALEIEKQQKDGRKAGFKFVVLDSDSNMGSASPSDFSTGMKTSFSRTSFEDPNFISLGSECLRTIAWLGSIYLPKGRVTDACEKESSLPVYDPEVDDWKVI